MRWSDRSHRGETVNRLSAALDGGLAERSGKTFCDLTISNPTRASLPYHADLLTSLANPAALTYAPEPFGLPSAREVVAREMSRAGISIAADHVVLTASTSEAYAYLLTLLADPGDAILVPHPSYPLFDSLGAYAGVELVPYELGYDGEWYLDAGALADAHARAPRARAVLTVSPNNPTGSYLKGDELEALARTGLPIVSDEVFATYSLTADARRAPTALASDGLVFALGGLSKHAALPQLKLAWIAVRGPAPLRDEALARLEHIADTYLSAATPVQVALAELLARSRPTVDAIRARLATNLRTLQEALADSPASPLKVEGGWSAIVRVPGTRTDEEWALRLLEEEAVRVQPGYFYDVPAGRTLLVLSLLTKEETFSTGIARLRRCVER